MTGNSTTKKIISIAKKYGFRLIRRKKHFVFRNDNGIQLVTAASPSDHRAAKNIEAVIKKLLKNHDSNHTD
jgi:predicted RNA binding protein YcfA (HicA-like mRNA interferase family)